ncbi:hypothetical protein ACWCQW_53405 [Streptomyces mirabilis]
MSCQVSWWWCVRELMAVWGVFAVAGLMPHLAERGIMLSSSQVVHRLVSRNLGMAVPAGAGRPL